MKKYKKPLVREITVGSEEILALYVVSYNAEHFDIETLASEEDCVIGWEHGHGTPFSKGGCWIDED